MQNKIFSILSNARNPLVLAVGGGNDSVSTLLLQKQLQSTFQYNPKEISIVAVLPDCLDYNNLEPTSHPLVNIITPEATRSVQGNEMTAFPEKILSANKDEISGLKIKNVYGVSMNKGSVGVTEALLHLLKNNDFDLIIAIDVGGDFIAVQENVDVLSPMMDGYMLYALKKIEQYQATQEHKIPVLYSVFGLGTDGESSPEMLSLALQSLNGYYEGIFEEKDVTEVIDFYRNIVEINRYSRTTDFTIQEIQKIAHDNPAKFRGRFHIQEKIGEKRKLHYGNFIHYQDPIYFGKYYLFDNISNVKTQFAIECKNGIEWFVNIQNTETKINHELNGQSYMNLFEVWSDSELNNKSLFFGTPSRKFTEQQHQEITNQVINSVLNNVYDSAIIYDDLYIDKKDGIYEKKLHNGLLLVSKQPNLIEKISKLLCTKK